MTDGRQKQTLRIASASIAAILEKHKEGMSGNAIDKLFGLSKDLSRSVIKEHTAAPENPKLGKTGAHEVSTSAVPLASTEDRSETREDARS